MYTRKVKLYPTETLYALGVNALDVDELKQLYQLKGRDSDKVSSWLVRSTEDIKRFAETSEKAMKIIEKFFPGQVTLVLQTKEDVSREAVAPDGTIGFRISPDPVTQKVITEFMEEHDGAPLTCTSANVSGAPTFPTIGEILQQFGEKARMIDEIIDDGPRKGLASTVVKVINDEVTVLREGEISEADILEVVA